MLARSSFLHGPIALAEHPDQADKKCQGCYEEKEIRDVHIQKQGQLL